jgi:short subunit dehydrogenase-like uncharacterized protein
VVEDPYALSPDRAAEPDLGVERDLDWVSYDSDLGRWVGPFLMAALNTRVVRRSNAPQDWAYGRRFRYREVTGFGTSPAAAVQAAAFSTALKAAAPGFAFGPSSVRPPRANAAEQQLWSASMGRVDTLETPRSAVTHSRGQTTSSGARLFSRCTQHPGA